MPQIQAFYILIVLFHAKIGNKCDLRSSGPCGAYEYLNMNKQEFIFLKWWAGAAQVPVVPW